jgi:hypothetical protein
MCWVSDVFRADFQELYDDSRGDMRKLMCHPRQHILAELGVFRDEDGEYLFDIYTIGSV